MAVSTSKSESSREQYLEVCTKLKERDTSPADKPAGQVQKCATQNSQKWIFQWWLIALQKKYCISWFINMGTLCNVSSCIHNHVSNLVTIAWSFILTFYLPRIATEYPLLQIWHSPSRNVKSQEETLLPPAISWGLYLFVGVCATILVQLSCPQGTCPRQVAWATDCGMGGPLPGYQPIQTTVGDMGDTPIHQLPIDLDFCQNEPP